MNWVIEADALYLTPAFFALSKLYRSEAQAAIDTYLTFLSIFVPTYVVAFAALVAFYFVPAVSRTNRAIHVKRSMLLYLPAALISKTPALWQLVAAILAETSGESVGALGGRAVGQQSAPSGPSRAAAAPGHDGGDGVYEASVARDASAAAAVVVVEAPTSASAADASGREV